ncbi:response regulator [Paenibacillus planticolens]|uniref:histidine kinase n=1 Tax=Paenibacillus planticolens TaxID=2654976 RepID=A0ABX1ZMZ0_9BACL|nr:response regulator [Paenibacillus planticolens]NOV01465.1 response regulator [Paenibacillus planticolens]
MSSSLRFKLVALLVLITTLSLSVVGFTNYKLSKDKLIQQLKTQSISSVSNSAQNLYDFLSIRLAEVELVSRVNVMRRGTLQEQLNYLAQELQTGNNRFFSMGVADLDGNLRLTSGDELNIKGERRFEEALLGKTYISDPYFGKVSGKFMVAITAPVYNDQKELTSLVVISLDAEAAFRDHLHPPVAGAQVVIVNDDGTILYHTDLSKIFTRNIFADNPSLSDTFHKALQQDEGYLDVHLENGKETQWFYARVPHLSWHLAYSLPDAFFQAPASPLFWSTVGLIVITAAILFLLIRLTANTLIISRIQQILRVTESVAAGDFYIKPLMFKSKDELGALAHSVNGMIENLRELFEPFEAFIQHNQYAMIVTDPHFTINHLNRRATELLGYTFTDVHKKATPLLWMDQDQLKERAAKYTLELGEFVPADCTALVIRTLRHLKEDAEWIWHRIDGTRLFVQVSVSAITHPGGDLKGYVIIARDISDIKESNETKMRLLTIVESARDAILTFDQQGYIFYMNQAGKNLIGLNKEQKTPCYFSEYVDIRSDIHFDEGLLTAIREGFWEFETEALTKEQRRIFVSVTVVPHTPAEKGERYFSAISRDITDWRHAKEELIRAKQEADDANLTKGIFLARMSHEIRTPLNGIVGLSHLMERTAMSSLQRDYMSKITKSSLSLSQIISDILDFSKLEADKLAIEHHAFLLDDTIDRVCETLSVLLGHKPVDFICDIEEQVPLGLIGDSLRLYQVLLNLTSNAIKFTEQGTVALRVQVEDLRGEEVRLGFTVTDTGIGMNEEQLARLFQPFMQADEVTSRKFGGTGLGLVISKSIIDHMGGTIEASSSPGIGSVFRFSIPFALTLQTMKTPMCFPLRALLVEDHPELHSVLLRTLQSMCKEGAGVYSWKEARKVIDVTPLEMVLLDMEAFDMYGEEVWLDMLEACNRNNLKTIIYTTLAGRDALEQLPSQAAPDVILVKPISKSILSQTLQNMLASDATGQPTAEAFDIKEVWPSSPRILLVEDNEINQTVARSLLESMNGVVHVASNGFEALQQLENTEYQIILMDIHMPDLDGIETTKRIRLEPEWRHIPIIALTADSPLEKRVACIRAGMNEVISKPIMPDRLFAAVNHILSMSGGKMTVPGLDTEEALERLRGKTDIYHNMLRKFHEQSKDSIDRLTTAIQQTEYDTAISQLHTLRGSASNLSAHRVLAAATELEEMLQQSTPLDETKSILIQNQLQTLAIALEEVFHTIQKLLLD